MNRNILWLSVSALLLSAACTQQESTAPAGAADRDDNVSIDADVNQNPAPGTTAPGSEHDTTIHSDVDVNTPGSTSGSATPERTEPQSDTDINADVDVNTQGTTRGSTDATTPQTPDTTR